MLPLIRGRLYLRFLHLATEPVYCGHSQDDRHSHTQSRDILYDQGDLLLIITGDSSYLDVDHYITDGVGIPSDSLNGDLLGARGKFMDRSHSHLACLSVLWQHSIASGSTVNQHSLPVPIDIGIAHIQESQPAGVGVIIPVGRVLFFVVYCWAMTGTLAGITGCSCATTAWGAWPTFALGPPFLFNSSWH